MAVATRLGTEFVPELEEGTLNIRTTLAPSSSLQTSVALAPKLQAILMEFPEVTYALSLVGRAELGGDPEPVSNIETYVGLKPGSGMDIRRQPLRTASPDGRKIVRASGVIVFFFPAHCHTS